MAFVFIDSSKDVCLGLLNLTLISTCKSEILTVDTLPTRQSSLLLLSCLAHRMPISWEYIVRWVGK